MHKGKTPRASMILLLVFSCIYCAFSEADITFNGDVQYRIRYHYAMLKDSEGKDSSAAPDLTNRYGWNLKWKIQVRF